MTIRPAVRKASMAARLAEGKTPSVVMVSSMSVKTTRIRRLSRSENSDSGCIWAFVREAG